MIPFATIYTTYYLKYVYYANKFVRDYDLAEDVVGDCAVKMAHREFEDIRTGNNLFLYYIKHHCINLSKKVVPPICSISWDVAQQEDDTAQIKAEIIFKIYQYIESLWPRCREIFKLHYLEQKTNLEICAQLHLSPQTVRNQLRTALKKIRIHFSSKKTTKKALILQMKEKGFDTRAIRCLTGLSASFVGHTK